MAANHEKPFQFSLRDLLWLTLAIAGVLAWVLFILRDVDRWEVERNRQLDSRNATTVPR